MNEFEDRFPTLQKQHTFNCLETIMKLKHFDFFRLNSHIHYLFIHLYKCLLNTSLNSLEMESRDHITFNYASSVFLRMCEMLNKYLASGNGNSTCHFFFKDMPNTLKLKI